MGRYGDIVQLWQGWRVKTVDDIDRYLENFRILFAYNSGKIENDAITYSDTREIFENGRVLNYSGSPRTLFELTNQKICYEFLKPKLAAYEPLTITLVKETHRALTGGTYDEHRYIERGERPGEFKKHDYVTGLAEVGSLPEDVESDLTELLSEIAELNGTDTMKAAAYFHARFEYIHPFADGNGRVGRTLLNYFLMLNNHPPVIIHDEDKAQYYSSLAAYDAMEDLEPMVNFLKQQAGRTWEKSLERNQRRKLDITKITADDSTRLESAGGYLQKYGRNIKRWIENGYITPDDCYVFKADDEVVGGVCFSDNTDEEREILDFALINAQLPNGVQALEKAVIMAAQAETKSVSYNLYNDTEQYNDILNVFVHAGFTIVQTKKSYTYEICDHKKHREWLGEHGEHGEHREHEEHGELSQSSNNLSFRSIAEVGEAQFVNTVKEVTVGMLDKLMADDMHRLGGEKMAQEYVDSMKALSFNPDWWRLGYCDDILVGLILPQKFDDTTGAINYIGVLPQHRGHRYGKAMIAEGTRILIEYGVQKIYADIDDSNYPMAAALEQTGYVFRMEESVLSYRLLSKHTEP